MKIAVFLPNWIGDCVMATPAMRAIRKRYPEAYILGVMRPYVQQVLAGGDVIDEVVPYNPRGKDASLHAASVVRRLRDANCDIHVLLPNSLRSAALSWFGRGRKRVGFARNGRGFLLTRPIRASRDFLDRSAVDVYCEVAAAADCPVESKRLELAVTADEEAEAEFVYRELGFEKTPAPVLLNPGGAFGPSKNWPTEHFVALAQRIVGELDRPVFVLCGPAEREQAQQVEQACNTPRIRAFTREIISLGGAKACIRRGAAMITTDSGPRHIAAALGIPSVVLFGSMPQGISENYAESEKRLSLDLACAPCRKRICPLGHHACMKDLRPEFVFRALRERLAKPAAA